MDVTKSYKQMYFCCGVVVIIAAIWLFIGNFINYRLLERERKQADSYKRTETDDPDAAVQYRKGSEGGDKATAELAKKDGKDGDAVQRETNI